MAKKVKVVEKRQPTRRQLARWEKERKRQKTILISAVSSIAVILIVLAYGFFITQVKPWNETIVTVNDVDFDMRYIVKMIKILGGGGNVEQTQTVASFAAGYVKDNELVRQGIKKEGFTASKDELDQEIRKVILGTDPDEQTQREFEKKYQERLKAMDMKESEFRNLIETEVLQIKYKNSLSDKLPQKTEQVHVSGILATNSTVDKAVSMLKEGTDFGTVAKELSVHSISKEKNGDMGWLPKGVMGEQFDQAAFSLEAGKLSDKIEDESGASGGGYWLIKVTEKDTQRELEDSMKQKLVSESFNKWLDDQRVSESNKVTINWDKEKLDFAVAKAK